MDVLLWVTNRIVNPALGRLLRARAGRRLGRRFAVIRYTGARTGRVRELVTGYARVGATVWIWVGKPGAKRWWRNFRTPADVELWLAGQHLRGRGTAVEGATSPDAVREGMAAYLAGVPGAARAMRQKSPPDAPAADEVRDVVLVRVDT